jgi:hypothetical protein
LCSYHDNALFALPFASEEDTHKRSLVAEDYLWTDVENGTSNAMDVIREDEGFSPEDR